MALVQASSAGGALVELDIGNSVESLGRLLDSQKELFHSQIDQLQKLVIAQCKLTGVNPLSQEMLALYPQLPFTFTTNVLSASSTLEAAGALSIKIGKRPRDLLNPKATKYIQSLFSIKDTIGKKETREISALCGITVTQVKDYFAGQRSRVRKLVRLLREKATRSDASKATSNGCSFSPGQSLLVSNEAPINTVDHGIVGECIQVPGISGNATTVCTQGPGNSGHVTTVCTQVPGNSGNITTICTQVPGNSRNVTTVCTHVPGKSGNVTTVQDGPQDPLKTDLKTVEEGPSCSLQEENIPGVDSDDKKFLENIFSLMRKEQTFSGQVKLMEWVLQIHNSAVLNWFSTKGGITILATWLSQAALEEQTTVLLVIFKVLCHLPLHKALPVQMSAILQTVNRLRFYRTSDISNRARILLSRWSKMFIRSQALKNPSFMNFPKNAQKAIIRKQRISEILSDGSWQSKIDIPEILALAECTDESRKSEPKRALKLLPESSDGSTKKHGQRVSSRKIKERRKVLLVEQSDHKMAGRNVQVARVMPSNHSRPMSADDIQKAKMRAIFMQHKYGKTDASTSENKPLKIEDHKVLPASQANNILPLNRIPQLPQLRRDEIKKPPVPTAKVSPNKLETSVNPKPNSNSQEQSWEKLKRDQLQWLTPPEIRINSLWRVGAGENSKELQVQTQRNRRHKETFYPVPQDIPPNPKEPWDTEMDFDDSLTPEIPTEQPPDLDSPAATAEGSLCSPPVGQATVDDSPATTSVSEAAPPPTTSNGLPGPDLELLAVLLKNPDLVFALTSSQRKSLTNDQMVALLDMLKKSGVGLTGTINGMVNNSKEKPKEPEPEPETTSLPSPTPPPDATRTGWRSEFPSHANTPLLQPQFSGSRDATIVPTFASQTPAAIPVDVSNQAQSLNIAPHAPTTILSLPQLTFTVNPTPQQHQPVHNLLPTKPTSMYPMQQSPNPEANLSSNRYQVNNPSLSTLLPIPLRPQPSLLSEPQTFQSKIPEWPPAASVERRDRMLDSWNGRPNGLLEVPVANSHFLPNHSNYNNNNNNNMYPRRNEMVDRSEMETWSPEGSPRRSPEYRSGRNFPELRRGFGRSQWPDWSSQWNSEHRERYRSGGSGRRRRERDRDRRR